MVVRKFKTQEKKLWRHVNRFGLVGDSILWKRAWSHGQKQPTGVAVSPEQKVAAVRMVRTLRAEVETERGTAGRVALQLG